MVWTLGGGETILWKVAYASRVLVGGACKTNRNRDHPNRIGRFLRYEPTQVEEEATVQQIIDDLIHDMTPVANGMFQIAIDELDEIGNDVELNDAEMKEWQKLAEPVVQEYIKNAGPLGQQLVDAARNL